MTDDLDCFQRETIDAIGRADWPAVSDNLASMIATMRQLRRELAQERQNQQAARDVIRAARAAIGRGMLTRELREAIEDYDEVVKR